MVHKRLTLHQAHMRWGMWTAGVVFIAAAAGAVVAFAREGQIDRAPWGYVAMAVAALAAVAGLLLAFAMAALESRGDE